VTSYGLGTITASRTSNETVEARLVKRSAALACAVALVALLLVSAAGAVPGWYWQWAKWRLGHDAYRCHAGDRSLRPDAPARVPAWAWDRLHGHTGGRCVKSAPAGTAPAPDPATAPTPPPRPTSPASLDPAEEALRDAVNATRQANGLPELAIEPRLQRAARERTADLVAHDYFAHEWHDGTPFATWIARYWPCGAGEILVMRTPSLNAQQAVQLWLASPNHRANMLSTGWSSMGVELGGVYGTVDFGGAC
jgi:uncharacterized protein YkwD